LADGAHALGLRWYWRAQFGECFMQVRQIDGIAVTRDMLANRGFAKAG
jgi:hypothetical protein